MVIVAFLLFVGACLGHISLWVFSNNYWFGLPLPHRVLSVLRVLHFSIILFGVAALALTYLFLYPVADGMFSGGPPQPLAVLYILFCALIGLIVMPAATLIHRLRRQPEALSSNHTRTLDIAAEIGYKPIGHGRYHLLAHLPFNTIFQVDLVERTLVLPQLPQAWDGLKILHVTDVHFCGSPDKIYFQRVMDHCVQWEPDLVAFTGDIVDSEIHHRWILPVFGRLRWRIAAFGILGNHDSWRDVPMLRRRLARIGIRNLGNRWEQIEVRGEPMIVIGQETPWIQPAPDLSDCPDGIFRLCLSHTPDNMQWARRNLIDLMLSGHTHGGQIRFPLVGSVVVPSRYGRRYDCGTFYEPPTLLHVGRGLAALHPMRYGCRPEVTLLILRTAAPDKRQLQA